jgi:hypothetical protein
MGIVAIGAFSLLQPRMHEGFRQTDVTLFMTSEAQIVTLFFEQQLGNFSVSKMTRLALSFLNYAVYVFQSEIFVSKLRVALHTFLANKCTHLSGRGRDTGSQVHKKT